jgi:hypothetical protein
MHGLSVYHLFEDIIKSEISQIGQRNKIIKIADRHGWDVVKEYTIHPLVEDNDDAVKPITFCVGNNM